MKRNDVCALILTHGRPKQVRTINALRKHGYTGDIFLVVDDEDKCLHEYQQVYGSTVVVFSKSKMDGLFDIADNIDRARDTVVYARNRCHEIAKKLGYRYFVELDDDYVWFKYTYTAEGYFVHKKVLQLDSLIASMVDFLNSTKALAVCLSQGGDHIGGQHLRFGLKRKAMNMFVCDTEHPFQFVGRMNDDVNTYCTLTSRGKLFFTIDRVALQQHATQAQGGGLTRMYLELGTYTKSFYSVMMCPSAVRVGVLDDGYPRIHHKINWHHLAPKIIREDFKKTSSEPAA